MRQVGPTKGSTASDFIRFTTDCHDLDGKNYDFSHSICIQAPLHHSAEPSKEKTSDTATSPLSDPFDPPTAPVPLHQLQRRVVEHDARRSCEVPHATAPSHHTQLNRLPRTLLLLIRILEREKAWALPRPVDTPCRIGFDQCFTGPKSPFLCTTSRACRQPSPRSTAMYSTWSYTPLVTSNYFFSRC